MESTKISPSAIEHFHYTSRYVVFNYNKKKYAGLPIFQVYPTHRFIIQSATIDPAEKISLQISRLNDHLYALPEPTLHTATPRGPADSQLNLTLDPSCRIDIANNTYIISPTRPLALDKEYVVTLTKNSLVIHGQNPDYYPYQPNNTNTNYPDNRLWMHTAADRYFLIDNKKCQYNPDIHGNAYFVSPTPTGYALTTMFGPLTKYDINLWSPPLPQSDTKIETLRPDPFKPNAPQTRVVTDNEQIVKRALEEIQQWRTNPTHSTDYYFDTLVKLLNNIDKKHNYM